MASKRKTNRRFIKWPVVIGLGIFCFLMAQLLFYTWCRVQCVQIGYAISEEARKQQELQALQNGLKVELTRLKAPEHISRIARHQLSLAMPDSQQIIVVPKP